MAVIQKPSVSSVNCGVVVIRSVAAASLGALPSQAAARALGAHPMGDAVLWAPDGIWLLEVARRAPRMFAHARIMMASWLLASMVLGSVSLAAMLAVRCESLPSTWSELGARVRRVLARFTLLAAGVLFVEVAVVALVTALVGFAVRPLVRPSDAEAPFVVGACLGVFAALVVHVLADLARQGMMSDAVGFGRAFSDAWVRLKVAPWRLASAALARAGAALVGLGLAGAAVVSFAPTFPWLACSVAFGSGVIPVVARSAWFGVLGEVRSARDS